MTTLPKKLEVDVYGEIVNAPVLRHPGRHFPGVLIQGDSLSTLCATSAVIVAALEAGRLDEATDEASSLHDRLSGFKQIYEDALRAAGIGLPYVT